MFAIVQHPDGMWSDMRSGTLIFSEMIGRLEISKQEWIRDYTLAMTKP